MIAAVAMLVLGVATLGVAVALAVLTWAEARADAFDRAVEDYADPYYFVKRGGPHA